MNKRRISMAGMLVAVILGTLLFGLNYSTATKPPATDPFIEMTQVAYIVFTNGTHYFAKNGTTGQIDNVSTYAHVVIQYAIEHLTLNREWKETIVFKGSFTITNQINLSSFLHLNLYGAKLTLNDNFTSWMSMLFGDNVQDVVIEGGVFDGNRDNQIYTNPDALVRFVENSGPNHRIKVKHNVFEKSKSLLLVASGVDIDIESNTFKDWGTNISDAALYSNSLREGRVINNYFSNSSSQAIYIGSSGSISYRPTIAFNTIVQTGYWPIKLWNAKNGEIAHNIVYDSEDAGIYVESCQDTIIESNEITEMKFGPYLRGYGIWICGNSTNTIIRGNTIRNAYSTGVELYKINGTLVEGNLIVRARRYGIALWASSRNHIVNNIIKNTGYLENTTLRYGIFLYDAGTAIGSCNNTIRSNKIYDDQNPKTQRYAIYENEIEDDYNLYAENDVQDNLCDPPIRKLGVHSNATRNWGYDEKWGNYTSG